MSSATVTAKINFGTCSKAKTVILEKLLVYFKWPKAKKSLETLTKRY